MKDPLVSIIIRTCGRPFILKNAIDSVLKQTYSNVEIVIVEDGSDISEEMLKRDYKNIKYQYLHTQIKVGRSVVGNLGLKNANGEYFNFLDDDDILLPNHVDTLIEKILRESQLVAYSIAEEYQIKVSDTVSYPYKIKRKFIRYKQPYNKLLLCYKYYLPIQSVMFHRSLFEKYGGFDEKLDCLEDWDMWVRYSTACDFLFISEVTSIYYTPYKNKKKQKRDILMKRAREEIIKNHKDYNANMNVEQINRDMDYILNVYTKTGLFFYMKKIRDFLLYRDI